MDALEQTLISFFGTDIVEWFTRLGLALALGVVIGFDREVRRKPAGLRSHMLVSLASASFTIITFSILDTLSGFGDLVQADPLRLMEAVIAGVAFLGAGAIIQGRGSVTGITTGASLWLAGALGVACGAGYFRLAALTAILGLVILSLIGWIERRFESGKADPDAN